MQNQIKFLNHNQIDKQRWDQCIDESSNGIIYAFSWYLDIVAPGWAALVYGDYEIVMPLPVRSKFGIKYIYLPYFCQQLGIFGKADKIDISEFINKIPNKFKLVQINLNEANSISGNTFKKSKNYKLNIGSDYTSIRNNYNRNCIRNLKKAENAGYIADNNLNAKEFSNFIYNNLNDQLENVGKPVYRILENLVEKSLENQKGEIVCLKNKEGLLMAAGFYLFDKNRLIFSVCASSKYGKENQAMYMLVDFQIRKYAGKYSWYDFSGSNNEGIAYFNSTFGAETSPYYSVSINRLPLWIRWLKK